MKFLKKLFGGGAGGDSSYDVLVRKVIELETLFSGDIVDNPNTVAVDIEGYKGMCYARCEKYQEEIGKRYAEIEELLANNDGSISPEKMRLVREFLREMMDCVRNAAREFFDILNQGDGKSPEEKRALNEKSYQYSVTMRQGFREQVTDLKGKL